MNTPRIVIVGGGITGLACAHRLVADLARARVEAEVILVDQGQAPGGHATTVREDGYVVEAGPNGFLDREPATRELVNELGLGTTLVEARQVAKRRFIVRNRRLCPVPDSPKALLSCRALGVGGTLRLLCEPFARRAPAGVDETIFDFAQRRIGREAAEMLVDAAVAGISAGDSRALSVRSQFPLMTEMERDHGSLIRAMVARRRNGVAAPRLMSFDGGLATLTDALVAGLGSRIVRGVQVRSVERHDAGWQVRLSSGEALAADHVVFACAARATAPILSAVDASLASALREVPYSGVQVVALAYRLADVPHPLDGYGYLVTRGEQLSTLGVVWESSLFPGRAPAGMALLRVFMGGARRPDAVALDTPDVTWLARQELRAVMGIDGSPERSWVFRWPEAIAQYTVGHDARIATIRRLVGAHPGMHVCGTSYDGVAFNQAIASGRATARTVASAVASIPASALLARVS